MNTKVCIFCGKKEHEFEEGNRWSEEHIIPLSLGNHGLKTYDVCRTCNNKLGEHVDHYLVNTVPFVLKRNILGLRGESGKIPIPFKDGVDQFNNKIRMDADFKPSIVPKLDMQGLRITGTANTKEEAKRMTEKKLKRMKYSDQVISNALLQIENTQSHSYQPIIEFPFTVDLNRVFLSITKIAYEYCCLRLGDSYMDDYRGKEIRHSLNKAINGEYKEWCPNILGVCSTPNELTQYLDLAEHLNAHMIFLHPDKASHLICEVFLFLDRGTAFSVIVSDNASKYEQSLASAWDIVDVY